MTFVFDEFELDPASGDVHIAYATLGSGDADIVIVSGWIMPMRAMFKHPKTRSAVEALARMGRVIQFDKRERDSPTESKSSRAWGKGASLRAIAPSILNDPEFVDWVGYAEQEGTSPGSALELLEMNIRIDMGGARRYDRGHEDRNRLHQCRWTLHRREHGRSRATCRGGRNRIGVDF